MNNIYKNLRLLASEWLYGLACRVDPIDYEIEELRADLLEEANIN